MSGYSTSNSQAALQRAQQIMSTLPANPDSTDTRIQRILSFWFDSEHPNPIERWFKPDPPLDAEIKSLFGDLIDEARLPSSPLNTWTASPDGTLALLILLDQFPRNIFRGSAEAFSSDAAAVEVTVTAIAKGYDRQVSLTQAVFFYMPLMHDENLLSQVAGVSLLEGLVAMVKDEDPSTPLLKGALEAAEKHRNAIMRWGRFPARNEALGRKSTDEELEFLKDHPFGL